MKDRNELAKIAHGNVVELGVAAGAYSKILLQQPQVQRLYSIDRWADHHDINEYFCACSDLAVFGPRSIPLRLTFAEAVPLFPDAFFDFIYIDGYAHLGQDDGQTLRDWWPKLKPGGVYAGHDYHPRYSKTILQVDAFVANNGLTINVTKEDKFPSWWVCKPAL